MSARPQTAGGTLMRKKEDMDIFGLDDDEEFFGKEITELLKKSQ